MARLVRAIHFPEARSGLLRFWKMDGRHRGGHDDLVLALMAHTKTYRGACLCGAIRYSFSGALDDAYFCHCSQCRKNYGMHGAFVGVARDRFVINKSKFLMSYKSSPETVRRFCGKCGSPISWDRKGYERIYVCLGLLEGKIAVPKVTHLHTDDKGGYYKL